MFSIIATLSGTVVERETAPLWTGFKDMPQDIICRVNYNSDKTVASLRWSTLQSRCDDHVFNLAKKGIA